MSLSNISFFSFTGQSFDQSLLDGEKGKMGSNIFSVVRHDVHDLVFSQHLMGRGKTTSFCLHILYYTLDLHILQSERNGDLGIDSCQFDPGNE